MKKITAVFTLMTLTLFPFGQSQAQEARAGIKGGLNFSNLYIDDADDESIRVSYHAGLFGQIMGDEDLVGLQLELLLSGRGSRANYNTLFGEGEYRFNLAYIDMPVLAVVKAGDVLEFHGGGYLGYLVGASTYREGDFDEEYNELARDHFKAVDFGLSAGMAINVSHLTVGVRYNVGLQAIADSEESRDMLGNAKNSFFQVYAGLSLQ